MNNRVLSAEEEQEYLRLKEMFNTCSKKLYVLGESKTADALEFPDKITVCKGSGIDTFATYTLERDDVKPNVDL